MIMLGVGEGEGGARRPGAHGCTPPGCTPPGYLAGLGASFSTSSR